MTDIIVGKLALMLDVSTAVFNRGSEHGVRLGQGVKLSAETLAIRDPDTAEHLGDYEVELAMLYVEQVRARISVCRVLTTTGRDQSTPVRIGMPMRTLD